MPTFNVNFDASLWWLGAYLILGFTLSVAFIAQNMKTQHRSLSSFGLMRTVKMVGLWVIGWPVVLPLFINDEVSAGRFRRNGRR